MSIRLLLILPLLLFATTTSAQQQEAVALRDTSLRVKPHSDAATLSKIKAKTHLQILQRKGGWYQARDKNNKTGWLRMSHIRLGDGSSNGRKSGLAQTLNFLSTGRSGASGVTVATGIRGLDSADVSNARPDHVAVKRLDHFKVSRAAAEKFAASGKLHEIRLRYLKEPE
jgi:hypothetical protein